MLRNDYTFGRPLTDAERDLLVRLISWRRGSRVITDESGAVVACAAHPDDLADFEKEVRKLNGGKLRAVLVAPERVAP
jgi:hypothetical protein